MTALVERLATSRGAMPAVLGLAFALRLAWALAVPVALQSDGTAYDMFARQISAGQGFSFPGGHMTLYWPVGTAAIYAAVYAVLGTDGWAVAGFNLVMGTALVAATGAVAARRFGRAAGPAAALAMALWPTAIMFTTVISSELPFMLLVALALLAQPGGDGPACWWRTLAATALLVAATFVRPTALPLVAALPLAAFVAHRRPGRAARELALAIALAAALLAPWVARNRALTGTPVLVSANLGVNLWMGNNPASDGGFMWLPPVPSDDEVGRDAFLKDEAMAYIKANPLAYARLCLARVAISFGRETIGAGWNVGALPRDAVTPLKAVASLYWFALLALGVAGAGRFLAGGWRRLFDPLILTMALVAAPAVLVVGMDRYHLPAVPLLAIFGGMLVAGPPFRRAKPVAPRAAEG